MNLPLQIPEKTYLTYQEVDGKTSTKNEVYSFVTLGLKAFMPGKNPVV